VLIGDGGKELRHPRLQNVERLPAKDAQLHPIGRIVRVVKVDKPLPHIHSPRLGFVFQNVQVARSKLAVGVVGAREGPLQLVQAPLVELEVPLVFGVHGPQLPVQGRGQEERFHEELGKAVQGAVEGGRVGSRGDTVIFGLA